MDPQTILAGLLTIGVGALSGGLTNAVAIWMLFHPHEPRGMGPFRLHGAMPKNKGRLAKSIGRTVGEKLLTAHDLSERLAAPEVRTAFISTLERIVTDLLETDRGSLREQLHPDLVRTLDELVEGLARRVADRLAAYAETPEFAALVATWVERVRRDLQDRAIGQDLTPERRAALTAKVDAWVEQLAEGEDLERVLRRFVEQRLERLHQDDRPLLDRVPPGLLGAVEQAIADYLPLAIERIGAALSDPTAKGRIQAGLREAFDRSVRDLLLHERLVAKLMVTDKTFQRLLEGFEREGFERFAASLTTPDMRAQLSRGVREGLERFLHIPVGERLDRLDPSQRASMARTLGDWLVRVARDHATRRVIANGLDRALQAAEGRTWGEVLAVLPSERAAELAAQALAGPGGRRWVEGATRALAERLLAQPIGRPANWLGAETTAAVKTRVAAAAWTWTQEQIPRVVEQFKIQDMVEQKVLGFSTQRMEEIVRGVTQRELTLIVRLGYVLGGIVGLLAFGINQLLR